MQSANSWTRGTHWTLCLCCPLLVQSLNELFPFILFLQKRVFKTMENDPVFARRPGEDLPLEKMRELTFLR